MILFSLKTIAFHETCRIRSYTFSLYKGGIFLDFILYEIVFVFYDSSIWKSNQLKLDLLRKRATIGTFTRQFKSTGTLEIRL